MATANVINGSDLVLFVISGATYKPIALAQTCKFSTSMSARKISSKDSGGFEESASGRISWTCDSDNLFTMDNLATSGYSFDTLMTAYLAKTAITVKLTMVTTLGMSYPQTAGSVKGISGSAFITKLDLNAKDADNASFTISLEGTGAFTWAT